MRGQIQNRERRQQIIDFSGLLFGKITPTDFDGVIEWQDRAYVLYELKHQNAPLPYGQRLCYERFVKDMQKAGKHAIVFVAEHDVSDTRCDIDASQCVVREFYFKPENGWFVPSNKYTARYLTQRFFDYVDADYELNGQYNNLAIYPF